MKAKLELVLTSATMNPEKAGGDDGETGSALRFDGDVLVDKLEGLFHSEEVFAAVVAALYGDKHDLRAREISTIKMELKLEKVKAVVKGPVIEDDRLTFTDCRLNSVELEPKHGRAVGVTLKIYTHPDDEQWNSIAATLRKTVVLSLSGGREIEVKPKANANQPGLPGLEQPKAVGSEAGPVAAPGDAAPGTH